MKWHLTRPRLGSEGRQPLAFVLGLGRQADSDELDPDIPEGYRPFEPPQHGGQHRRRPGDMVQRPYTTAPTKTPLDVAVARKLLIGRVTLSIERRPRPAAAAGLAPAAHTAPPVERLALEVPALPTPPRIPHFDDLKRAQFATGQHRAPSAERRPSVAGLFPALPAAPARHALPGGAK